MRLVLVSSIVLALVGMPAAPKPAARRVNTPRSPQRRRRFAGDGKAPPEPGSVPVTADNYGRAATDLAFANVP